MKIKIVVLAGLFLLSFICVASAVWDKKPEFRFNQLYRFDLRQQNHQLYTNRLSAAFTYRDREKKALFKLEPFFEARRNVHNGIWERKLLGTEIGRDIFPWVYLGEAIQKTWIKEDYKYYTNYGKKSHPESITRLLFSKNLLSGGHIKLKGFVLDEYTFDFDRGAGICNEVAIGVSSPLNKYVEATINWRHIDRIHYFDSDTFEASVALIF